MRKLFVGMGAAAVLSLGLLSGAQATPGGPKAADMVRSLAAEAPSQVEEARWRRCYWVKRCNWRRCYWVKRCHRRWR